MKPRNSPGFNFQPKEPAQQLGTTGDMEPAPHSTVWEATWPRAQHRRGIGQAEPNVPGNRQLCEAFLLTPPLPAACPPAEGLGLLHTLSTAPAGIAAPAGITAPAGVAAQSCLGATFLWEHSRFLLWMELSALLTNSAPARSPCSPPGRDGSTATSLPAELALGFAAHSQPSCCCSAAPAQCPAHQQHREDTKQQDPLGGSRPVTYKC